MAFEVSKTSYSGRIKDIKLGTGDKAKRRNTYLLAKHLYEKDLIPQDLMYYQSSDRFPTDITYKLKEATSNDIKIGTLKVVTNGTSIAYSDIGVETLGTGVSFDAIINGANVEIRYSSGANAATMRADIKRFLS